MTNNWIYHISESTILDFCLSIVMVLKASHVVSGPNSLRFFTFSSNSFIFISCIFKAVKIRSKFFMQPWTKYFKRLSHFGVVFYSPQIKQNYIIINRKRMYELLRELANNLKHRTLGNFKKILAMSGIKDKCPVDHLKPWQLRHKIVKKQI